MRVHFLIDQNLSPLKGALVYRAIDSAFDFAPLEYEELLQRAGKDGLTSLTVGTLQIEIGVGTSIALYVWGYNPQESWSHKELPHLDVQPGAIRIAIADELLSDLDPGISIELVEINEWLTIFDAHSGWIRIGGGSPDTDSHSTCIEFATNTVAIINDGVLTAVWLHPHIE